MDNEINSPATLNFTVAIPTYNGANRLADVLEALKQQILPKNFTWEIIVIDNNSKDQTAQVVKKFQNQWSASAKLKYSFEGRQGAAFARQRAICEAKADLIGFLDDDNIPDVNWVAAAYEFAQSHPQAGAFGSQIHGDFEVPPPENFERILPFLAIVERGDVPLLYEPSKKLLPPSAGLVVRKQAWLENVPAQLILKGGRLKGKFLTGEDLEVLSHIQQSDWEIWYNPQMQLNHKIPSWRFEKDYLLFLLRCIGLSRHVTRMLSVKPGMKLLAFAVYFVNDIRKIILHLLKHNFNLKHDVVAMCELQLYVHSLISPFYLWLNGYFHQPELEERLNENTTPVTLNH